MSKFLPNISKTYEFEGDTIAATFKRLTRQQMMAIQPLSPKVVGRKDDKPILEEQAPDQQVAMMDLAINSLKENMVSFTGLKDGNGEEVKFEVAVDQAYFTGLMSGMTGDLLSESMVNEKKPKQ